jgi:hypothetical protein
MTSLQQAGLLPASTTSRSRPGIWLQEHVVVVVGQGCHTKATSGWLQEQTFIFSEFWRLEPKIKELAAVKHSSLCL